MRKKIPLSQGGYAIVDDGDFDWLSSFNWRSHRCGANNCRVIAVTGYIKGKVKNRRLMHRMLWERHFGVIPKGHQLDHINHNPLDNRLSNLRLCTRAQNKQNSRPYKGTSSRFKGVSREKSGKWHAYIRVNKSLINLGRFEKEGDAARAYNRAAAQYFGEFAHLNEV